MIKKEWVLSVIVFCIFFYVTPTNAGIIYSNNFENEDASCWNNTSKDFRSCGDFKSIGKGDLIQLSSIKSRSGSHAALWKIKNSETTGQAYIRLPGYGSYYNGYDELYIQIWNYFTGDDGTFDHGTQPKFMRVNSHDGSKVALDIVVQPMDKNSDRDTEQIKVAFNGGPNDWGAAYSDSGWVAPNNRWTCWELHIKLNKPGSSDGLVELFVDGVLTARQV